MKKFQLAILSGLVGAMTGSLAQAAATTETADVIVYLSGSTAAGAAITNAVKSVCDAATFETYIDATSKGGDYKTWFCRSKGVTGINDGTKISVRLTGASKVIGDNVFVNPVGGSMLGVVPIAYKQKLSFLAVSPATAAACSGDPLSSTGATCTETTPGALTPVIPQFGLSDLYPSAFIGQNAPAATGAIGSDALARLKVSPSTVVIFNTPITKALRDKLQDVQFAAGKLDPACTALTNRELGVCTPSLTGEQIAKVISGQVSKWNEVDPALEAKEVRIIRRDIGSGTQATLNLVGMSAQYKNANAAYPCVGGSNPEALNLPNVRVVSTSGAMVTALNNAETAGEWAMGLLDAGRIGAGKDVAPIASAGFRFVKIDGYAPTMVNVAAGKYVFIGQVTVNRREPWDGSAQEKALVDAVTAALNDPSIVAKGNTSSALKHNFGDSGYMVVGATSCTTEATCAANPVTAYRFAANPADAPTGYCLAPKAVW